MSRQLGKWMLCLAWTALVMPGVSRAELLGPFEEFIDQARAYDKRLRPLIEDYREAIRQCSQETMLAGAVYDQVLTTPNSQIRDVLIDKYRERLPQVAAQRLSLKTATQEMESSLKEVRDFIGQKQYAPYRDIPGYQKIRALMDRGFAACTEANDIPNLIALPDPIPEPIKPGEVTNVAFLDSGLEAGKEYPVEVEVRNNLHYSTRTFKVEIRVHSGPAKIKGAHFKTIELRGGHSGKLTWQLMPTDVGDFDFDAGARVVE